ncbi:MAG: SCO family protein [Burkholderiales bacterium]|nr:SCO family protein [Burkholderiales bacterium]
MSRASAIASAWLPVALFCLAAAVSSAFPIGGETRGQRGEMPRQSDRFSNVTLYTQHGKAVHFYDDLVKGKTVIINLMYSGCGEICPANSAELASLNQLLGQRMGRDVTMLSLSIDPLHDTPQRLKQYWEAFGSKPGWLFLTGSTRDIERLRRELGAYDLDPVIDADPSQHAGYITVGNDNTNRWLVLPLQMDTSQLLVTILRTSRNG